VNCIRHGARGGMGSRCPSSNTDTSRILPSPCVEPPPPVLHASTSAYTQEQRLVYRYQRIHAHPRPPRSLPSQNKRPRTDNEEHESACEPALASFRRAVGGVTSRLSTDQGSGPDSESTHWIRTQGSSAPTETTFTRSAPNTTDAKEPSPSAKEEQKKLVSTSHTARLD
jgi:hypothetical protein